MASVTVFVDDAVRGRMPMVCARTGAATDGRLRITTQVASGSHAGVVWLLLLLAGPIGWLVAAFLVVRGGGEELAVEVPYSNAAYEELLAARRLRTRGLLVGLVGGGALAVLPGGWASTPGAPGLVPSVAVLVAGLAVAAVGRVRLWRADIDVRLDASRRWVTLSNVHSELASACRRTADRDLDREAGRQGT